jgi:uncharacterized membrane protein
MLDPLRHLSPLSHLNTGAFGGDRFGKSAERFARFFGTPKFLVGQTLLVAAWIALNVTAVVGRWDPYPFILLNLLFSTQAAYAAPLILLAQTRQADRDKALAEADARHREDVAERHAQLLRQNTDLIAQVHGLASALVRHSGLDPESGAV